jgi:hypothetical protein
MQRVARLHTDQAPFAILKAAIMENNFILSRVKSNNDGKNNSINER